MVYNLLHYEGIFVGASSALNMVGAVKTAEAVGKGKTVGELTVFVIARSSRWWRDAVQQRTTVSRRCYNYTDMECDVAGVLITELRQHDGRFVFVPASV